ncbi:MAG: extracellular matrix regulator RemB [Candidatus Onthomonas sp.]
MYLHLGQSTVIREKDIIGIFDLDITSQSYRTRQYLNRAEKAGQVINVSEELPKSFVVCQRRDEKRQRVYLAQPASGTLQRRLKNEK